MTLSGQTIKNLREIINEKSQYRSGPQLVDFFNTLGFHDCYGQGFPSRWVYTEENLKKINGTSDIDECIKTVFAPNNFIDKPELLLQLLEEFNKYLSYDGWKAVIIGKAITFQKASFDFNETFKIDVNEITEEDFKNIKVTSLNISKLPIESRLLPIIQQRIDEIDQCAKNNAPLATIFLCGSVLEGILSAIALQNAQSFNTAKSSPKDNATGSVRQFNKWTLKDYIDVAKELGYIDLDVQKFSHVLQNFRNYIHPYQQLHEKFSPNIDTAKLCVQVVKIAINQIGDLKHNTRTN